MNKKLTFILFLTLMLGILSTAWTTTLEVPGTYATIQAAIAAAVDNDVIEVDAGTYLIPAGTQLIINKQITLKAKADVTTKPRIRTNLMHWSQCNVQIAADNVVVDAFEIDNALYGTQAGYIIGDYGAAKNGWTVKNCDIHDGRNCIRVIGNNVTIEGNDLHGTNSDLINCEYGKCGGLKVTRNILHSEWVVSGGKPAGVTYNVDATTVGDVEISYNIVYGCRTFVDFQHNGGLAPLNNILIMHNTVDWKMEALPTPVTGSEVAQQMSIAFWGSGSWDASKINIRDNIFSRQKWYPIVNTSGAGGPWVGSLNITNNLFYQWYMCDAYYPSSAYPNEWPAARGAVGWAVTDTAPTITNSIQGDPLYAATGTTADVYYALTTGSPAQGSASDGTNIGAWQPLPPAGPVHNVTQDTYFNTIQAAIDAANPAGGDLIEVSAGTYTEELTITKALTLNGADGAILDGATLGLQKNGVKIKSGNVTFNNIDVVNFSGNGIIVGYEASIPGNLQNVHITNCLISNIQPGYSWGFGIYIGYESEGFGNGKLTSHLDYSGLLIENNEITNTADAVLCLQSITASTGTLQVLNNYIHEGDASGVWIDCARNIDFEDNIIDGNAYGFFFSAIPEGWYVQDGAYGAQNINIIGNEIINNTVFGVGYYNGWTSTIVIEDNLIDGNPAGAGVKNYLTGSLDASPNWWGDLNPADDVYGNVVYVPMWSDATMTTLYYPPVHNVTQNTWFTTIQAAINAAVDHNVIEVAAGTYTEDVIVNKPLTLLGANADIPYGAGRGPESIIQPATSGTAPLSIGTSTMDGPDNVTINGFEITGPLSVNAIYCGLRGPSYLNIIYNYIHHIGTDRATGTVYAINYRCAEFDETDINISHNYFDYIFNSLPTATKSSAAIWMGQSTATGIYSNVLIEYNTIKHVESYQGTLFGTDDFNSSGINIGCGWKSTGYMNSPIIRYNNISDLTGSAVYGVSLQGNTPGAVVNNNTFTNFNTLNNPQYAAGLCVFQNIGWPTNNGTGILAHNNSFTNMHYGIYNATTNVVDGTLNWWGHASGPLDDDSINPDPESDNPNGLGVETTGYVMYDPWWADEEMTIPGSNNYVANGQYSFTVHAPNSEDGAQAKIWGFYTNTSNAWVSATYGTGTFTNGYATVNYIVPANFSRDFYWEVLAYQTNDQTRSVLWNTTGPWGQFDTYVLNGQTIDIETYRFDDFTYSTTSASFKMVGANDVIPTVVDYATVEVMSPWSGNIEDYGNSVYNDPQYRKIGLYPSYAIDRGFTVEVIASNPSSPQFQEVKISKPSIGYEVTLFGFYLTTPSDPLGYMWWTTFPIDPVSEMTMTYNSGTGFCSGTFATPLSYGVQYFIQPYAEINITGTDLVYSYNPGSMDMLLNGITLGPVHNITQGTYYNTIQTAIAAANPIGNDEIEVAAGEYIEIGQIVISKSLTITGAGEGTVVKPDVDYTSSDGWIKINSGRVLNISGMKFDGTDKSIDTAMNFQGNGVVNNCWFNQIKNGVYGGDAIWVENGSDVDVLNSDFTQIGRDGILHCGTGLVQGNTYLGKGDGDWLDYFILAEYGCDIIINDNEVSNCTGIAQVDGSGSAAIAVWDDAGTTAVVTNNVLTDNSIGIGIIAGWGSAPYTDPVVDIGYGNIVDGGEWGITVYNYYDYDFSPTLTFGATTLKGQSVAAIDFSEYSAAGMIFDGSELIFDDGLRGTSREESRSVSSNNRSRIAAHKAGSSDHNNSNKREARSVKLPADINHTRNNGSGSRAIITDNFDIEDLVIHAIDAGNRGLIVWNPNNVYVTPDSYVDPETAPAIKRAIAAVTGDYTINVKVGTYTEVGQILIDKDISIVGQDKETTFIKPAQDTGGSGSSQAFIFVQSGSEFNLSNTTIDCDGRLVRNAIRTQGSGTIDNNIIKNVYYSQYLAWGMAYDWSVGGQNWTISNNTFENIERVSILVDGQTNVATITHNEFIGKGDIDCVNYGVEVGDGANAAIEDGNSFEDFLGVANDGSGSAGIMVTSYFGPNPTITVTSNNFTDCSFGIMVGYDGTDTSTATISSNTFTGVPCYVIASADGLLNFYSTMTDNTFNNHKVLLLNGTSEFPYALFSTIQGAIDYASDGDEIQPQPDTYAETLNIEGRNDLIITGSGNRAPTIIKPATTLPWNALGYTTQRRAGIRIVESDNITISGIVLDCELIKNNGYTGLLYANSTGGLLQGSTFKNMYNDQTHYYDVMVYAKATDPNYTCADRATLNVVGNQFIDTGRLGIVTHNAIHTVIDENSFYKTTDCFGYGMEIGSTSTAEITDNIIWGFDTPAVSDGSISAGIYIENAFTSTAFGTFNCLKPVTIEGNEIYNCQEGITVGNQFDNYAGNVDMIVDIIDNNIHDNIDIGILITDEDKTNGSSVTANLTGNTITTALSTVDDIGIFVYAVGDGDINVNMQGNTISNYDYGLYVYSWGTPTGSLFDLSVTNGNTFDELSYAIVTGAVNWESTPVVTGNNFLTNPVHFYDFGTLNLSTFMPPVNTYESAFLDGQVIYYEGSAPIYTGIEVYLQGPYVTGGTMNHNLTSYMPLTSPFDEDIVLDALPTVSGHYLVDWVYVELRKTATGASEQGQSCFLLENGTVVDVLGNPVLEFETTGNSSFYVIVRHRNHLGIMSASAHTFNTDPLNPAAVDLTVAGSVYGGDDLGAKVIESGILAMYSGDTNGNGFVQTDDLIALRLQLGYSGYLGSDLNLNSLVQNTDLYYYELPNIGKNSQIPAAGKASDAPNSGKAKLNKVK